MLPLIDTHIHLDFPAPLAAGADRLAAARSGGVGGFVIPGVKPAGWADIVALARQQSDIYAAPGLHPAYAEQWDAAAAEELVRLAAQERVVAIGEIGLDGAVGPGFEIQERVLREQLAIGFEVERPVLLHARQATGRLLEILRELQVGHRVGGIWHGFSASLEVARQLVDEGFLIGVGPILLRKNARKLPQTVTELPLTGLVLETDYPDMTEEPAVLLQVAERIAVLREEPLDMVLTATTANAQGLLGFDLATGGAGQ